MELRERKREKQGIQAFVPLIIGPTNQEIFHVFLFLYEVVATSEFLRFSDLAPKLRREDEAK